MIGIPEEFGKRNRLAQSFRMIPDSLWQCPDVNLSGATFKVVCAMLRLPSATSNSPHVWVSNERLAQEIGTTVRTVQYSLKKLEKAGLITRTTATTQEAGATHRLIRLDFFHTACTQRETESTYQDSGPPTHETGAETSQDSVRGGEKNCMVHPEISFTPIEKEGSENQSSMQSGEGQSESEPVVAFSPPGPEPKKPDGRGGKRTTTRPQAPRSKADQKAIADEATQLEGNIIHAFMADAESPEDSPTAQELLAQVESDDQPEYEYTVEAIRDFADFIAKQLHDPEAIATYRSIVCRSAAARIQAMWNSHDDEANGQKLTAHLMATIRGWAFGRVREPAKYFTRRAVNAARNQVAEVERATRPPKSKATAQEKPRRQKATQSSLDAAASAKWDTGDRYVNTVPQSYVEYAKWAQGQGSIPEPVSPPGRKPSKPPGEGAT